MRVVSVLLIFVSSSIAQEADSASYQRHYELLPVAAASFILAWDYGLQARDLSRQLDSIDQALHDSPEYNQVYSLYNRKRNFSIAFGVIGAITTYFSFKKSPSHSHLQFSLSQSQLSLLYRF